MKRIEIKSIDDFVNFVNDLLNNGVIRVKSATFDILNDDKPYLIEREFFDYHHSVSFSAFFSSYMSFENRNHFSVKFCLTRPMDFRKRYFVFKKTFDVLYHDKLLRIMFYPFMPSLSYLTVTVDCFSNDESLSIFDKIG